MMLLSIAILGAVAFSQQALAAIPVKITLIEALAPRDTTSSTRFQKDYELAIDAGKRGVASRLKACGYELMAETLFYDAGDPLQAREKGASASQSGAWLMIGPRRSNHFLLLAQGAQDIPAISLMASASEIAKLGERHISLSPLNGDMAAVAAEEARRRVGKKSAAKFISIISADCVACTDFADSFTAHATRSRMREAEKIMITGDNPDLSEHIARILASPPEFFLLPNYSKVSSYLISKLSVIAPRAFFVGGDGWGDANFGFVHRTEATKHVEGFSVRGYPPLEMGLKEFPLGRKMLGDPATPRPSGAPAMGILRTLDIAADVLCAARPKTRQQFAQEFERHASKRLKAPWGVSVYELRDGGVQFLKTARASRK